MGKTHTLKTWPSYFAAVESGAKTFELRQHDRDFAVGDSLDLHEFDPDARVDDRCGGYSRGQYTGRALTRRVSYMMTGGQFGLAPGWVIMGLGSPVPPRAGGDRAE